MPLYATRPKLGTMQLLMSAYDSGGADSTTDLQNALAAAATVALAHGRCQLILDSRDTYVVGGAVTAGSNGQLAQIPLPYSHNLGTVWVEIKGQPGGDANSGAYASMNGHLGTCIQGTLTSAPTYSAATGIASIMGGPASYATNHATNAWRNDICYSFDDITFLQPNNPPLCCVDVGWAFQSHIGNMACQTTQVVDGTARSGFVAPTNRQGMGVIFPNSRSMNPPMRVGALTVEGYYTGVTIGELLAAEFLQCDTAVIGIALDASYHANSIVQYLDVNNVYGIGALDIASGIAAPAATGKAGNFSTTFPSSLAIHHWDIQENNGQTTGMNRIQDLYDTSNLVPLYVASASRITAGGGSVAKTFMTNGGKYARYSDIFQGSPWIAVPSLLNSWVNFGGVELVASYYKDSNNYVHLQGMIKSGTVGQPAFQLPVGFRPGLASTNNAYFAVVSNNAFGQVVVQGTGNVVPASPSSNTWVALSHISFLAEQ